MTYRVKNICLAIALAVVAALLVSFYVTNYKRNVENRAKDFDVLVATKDIPAGTAGSKLSASLTTRKFAKRNVVPGAVSNRDEIKQLVSTQPIFAGEQVTVRRFSSVAQRGVRAELKGNMRAISVPGDGNQLLAGTLKPGDRIDVVASIKYKVSDVVRGGAGDLDRIATRVVLRDLRVLRSSETDASAKLTRSSSEPFSVLLAVTDSQAQKLFFVLKNGDWSLQLRPTVDAADSPESIETVESVLGDGLKGRQYRQLYAGKDIR